jgi:hypothetical protein
MQFNLAIDKAIRILPLIAPFLLFACASSSVNSEPPAYQAITAGSVFILNSPVEIPPYEAGVYIQSGKVTHYKHINSRYPNCRLEVKNVKESAQPIAPDSFTVVKVNYGSQYVMKAPQIFASLGDNLIADSGGGHMAEEFTTYFFLQSDKQPDVFRMRCQYWEEPGTGRQLRLSDVRKALGDLITLSFPNTQSP